MTMSDFNPRPSDKLTASERKELDTSEFGIPQLREFPIHDAAHVRAAEARRKIPGLFPTFVPIYPLTL